MRSKSIIRICLSIKISNKKECHENFVGERIEIKLLSGLLKVFFFIRALIGYKIYFY